MQSRDTKLSSRAAYNAFMKYLLTKVTNIALTFMLCDKMNDIMLLVMKSSYVHKSTQY